MQINPTKSTIINVEDGQLVPKSLTLLDNSVMPPVEGSNCIKYLRINFNDEIVFDRKSFLSQLEKDFRNLVTSPLLRGDQKLNILNQYVYPKLIYPMQTTPIDLLDKNFLKRVDMLVRQGTREICGLPADTPIPVYYTGRKYRYVKSDVGGFYLAYRHRPKASARPRSTLTSSSRSTPGRSTVSRTLRSRNRPQSARDSHWGTVHW